MPTAHVLTAHMVTEAQVPTVQAHMVFEDPPAKAGMKRGLLMQVLALQTQAFTWGVIGSVILSWGGGAHTGERGN